MEIVLGNYKCAIFESVDLDMGFVSHCVISVGLYHWRFIDNNINLESIYGLQLIVLFCLSDGEETPDDVIL